ncbi:hypothetical protein Y032_0028g1801 [Ancylostoma ceylanicum]|uniref:Uncharacterized protein n=1 Tax=Ancylostoma ceylanicum TaxID=53326 RepID=A0A016UU38_9BILA|nr:hypothetical protein Y032_0028g1801 [Ancylostoma ceylanicum]
MDILKSACNPRSRIFTQLSQYVHPLKSNVTISSKSSCNCKQIRGGSNYKCKTKGKRGSYETKTEEIVATRKYAASIKKTCK